MRKALYVAGAILFVIVVIVVFFRPAPEKYPEQPISVALNDMKSGRVENLEVRRNVLTITLADGSIYKSRKEEGVSIFTIFESNNIDPSNIQVNVKNDSNLSGWFGLLINFLPILFFVGLLWALVNRINRRA
jgi:ATP-dependent Zn protease